MMSVDPTILQSVAVYDSAMEQELSDLRARVASADWNAAQSRDLVSMAQADLQKQDQMRKELKAEVAALTEAKAEVEAQLATKSEEVAKFVEGVEAELKESRERVKTLSAELEAVKADLAERTTEVTTLNAHLEAHTGATVRLNKEVSELKEALAAAA